MQAVYLTAGDRDAADRLVRDGTPGGRGWEPNIGPDTIVYALGRNPIMVVTRYEGDMGRLRAAFRAYPMTTTKRAVGIRNRGAVFGNVSRRVHMKREGCRACGGAGQAPGAHQAILDAGASIARTLGGISAEFGMGRMEADRALASEKIPTDWRLDGTPWTSGVLNETSPLPYHYDRNNLATWSAMIVARMGVDGGHLHLPEHDLVVECRDGDIVWFPGWHFVHGVTPIRKRRADGYRYTAVFYTIAGMSACLPFEEEMAWAKRSRSEREDTLLARQAASGLLDQ